MVVKPSTNKQHAPDKSIRVKKSKDPPLPTPSKPPQASTRNHKPLKQPQPGPTKSLPLAPRPQPPPPPQSTPQPPPQPKSTPQPPTQTLSAVLPAASPNLSSKTNSSQSTPNNRESYKETTNTSKTDLIDEDPTQDSDKTDKQLPVSLVIPGAKRPAGKSGPMQTLLKTGDGNNIVISTLHPITITRTKEGAVVISEIVPCPPEKPEKKPESNHDEEKMEEEVVPPEEPTPVIAPEEFVNDGVYDVYDKEVEKSLQQLEFYHGYLPREDLFIMKNVGDYLLRITEVEQGKQMQRQIVMSVQIEKADPKEAEKVEEGKDTKAKRRNLIIRRKNGRYLIDVNIPPFGSMMDFVDYYTVNEGTVSGNVKFKFITPVCRQKWEFSPLDVNTGKVLGKGAFGEVRTGTLKKKSGRVVQVALKVAINTTDVGKEKIKEMMKEARLTRGFKHPNLVRVYGVSVLEHPLMIIMELVSEGDLSSYLKANKTSERTKLHMCIGAAKGIQFIHDKSIMHRDIAARNCLVTKERVVKISDFGLSRQGVMYKLKRRAKMPIRWMSPESLFSFWFTLRSDVFSYGVLIYEIYTDGGVPWEGKTNAEVKQCLQNGQFLSMPRLVPKKLRVFVVEKVFTPTYVTRASITDVLKILLHIERKEKEHHNKRRKKSTKSSKRSHSKSSRSKSEG